ncbi:MAG TPA: aminomethyl-transferring glycine dehydrogenase subunit GcvPA [Candidatus Latescibacteria bacterium]|nr:aminomethyl-transferring glycine dehydrogenase subunit GcvPA [Candidatus Latescibacterota bacterium]
MDYTPHTEEDITTMLAALGLEDVQDLRAPIPDSLRMPTLDLPPGMTEMEGVGLVDSIAAASRAAAPELSFLGAGAYDHFAPSVVDATISRGEFFTAYTPYQPEVSQGTLRVIFEFQTMMCELTGMEVANASMYDGSSALAEAVLMAMRIRPGKRVILPRSLHPFYRSVVETYVRGIGLQIVTAPWTLGGTIDLDWLADNADDSATAVVIQNPNFLGVLEPLDEIGALLADRSPLSIAAVNPITLGQIEPPGSYGADIVVGDGQPLGLPLSFGGPYVGFFATRHEHIRRMPGRIVGQTTDVNGKRAYVLTLKTREQDIRRDKATSNICTNQTLCGTAVTVYLSALGPKGLAEVGAVNWERSHTAQEALCGLPGVSSPFGGPFFNEFVWQTPMPATDLLDRLSQSGISAGVDLGRFYEDLSNCVLTCVTEKRSPDDVDRLVKAVEGAI